MAKRKEKTSEDRLILCLGYCHKAFQESNHNNAWRLIIRHFIKEEKLKIKSIDKNTDFGWLEIMRIKDEVEKLNNMFRPLDKSHQNKVPFGYIVDAFTISASFVGWAKEHLTKKELALCTYIFQNEGWIDWEIATDKDMNNYIRESHKKGLPDLTKNYN